ncbi:vWA domain-containing protein [Pseudalkalibacillus hwajinpoensis]|uniref:VWA domain-containing protein n=1 Tax=Guptibacillus hwajinpoensis TaxID=208199 RepID=A0A4U1ML54_9BACL|nr:VWA domain-containing protein [Pseudalkalibacillus hwajinpoensis]TKD71431.1 VWA domain-containing protein [Pseudalkalibacillus hwajinpoensis]
MKFLNFAENQTDPFLHLSLSDLAETLSNSESEVQFAFHSYYRPAENLITVSHYWNDIFDGRQFDGMKSDIYLRALGNVHFTDFIAVDHYLSSLRTKTYPSFRKQLFALVEDIRIESLCIIKRPGMSDAFETRRSLFQKRFRGRLEVHNRQNQIIDSLFCAIYLQAIGKPVALGESLATYKPYLRHLIAEIRKAKSTKDVAVLTNAFCDELSTEHADMTTEYLTMYGTASTPSTVVEDEQARELKSDDTMETTDNEDKETYDEEMNTWHEEQEQEGSNFLQFDLEEGAKSDLIGEGERKEESGDQAFVSVQGASKQSEGSQFDEEALLESRDTKAVASAQDPLGEANRNVKEVIRKAEKPSGQDQEAYRTAKAEVQYAEKSLRTAIQKTIEQKQIAPRSDLHFGRLNRKLLRLLTDENPRLFYKKNAPSAKLDVTFSLLVDCSASMYDKMVETRLGITLFHETLKGLDIKHSITGFYEDAFDADDQEQPNTLFQIIDYNRSTQPNEGAKIMQLEPEEDNRDGYAIRKAAEELAERNEKHKILIVFTDGEPSAFDYSENGIVDTHEAVIQTRKKGYEVIGVFLSNGEPQEKEKNTMRNIYGTQSIVIPSANEIPAYLTPLLKRLLLRFV